MIVQFNLCSVEKGRIREDVLIPTMNSKPIYIDTGYNRNFIKFQIV